MSLTKSKIEAFFKEFPFLKKCLDPYLERLAKFSDDPLSWIGSIQVSRLDLEALEEVPHVRKGSRYDNDVRLVIVDKSGREICEVSRTHWEKHPQRSLFRPSTWFSIEIEGQKLSDALAALPSGQDFGYVVWISDTIFLHVRIYKLPKSFSLNEWVEELKDRAVKEIRDEVSLSEWDGESIKIIKGQGGYFVALPDVTTGSAIDDIWWAPTIEEALGKFVCNRAAFMGLKIEVRLT